MNLNDNAHHYVIISSISLLHLNGSPKKILFSNILNKCSSLTEAKFDIHMRPQIDLKLRNSFMKFVFVCSLFNDVFAVTQTIQCRMIG